MYFINILYKFLVILVADTFGNFSTEHIKTQKFDISSIKQIEIRYFHYMYIKYVWLEETSTFEPVSTLEPRLTFNEYLENKKGLSYSDQKYR